MTPEQTILQLIAENKKLQRQVDHLERLAETFRRKYKDRCPHCGEGGVMTRDHILQKRFGHGVTLSNGARNIRKMCARCNGLREKALGCIAVVEWATAIGKKTKEKPIKVLAAWGYKGNTQLDI